MTKIRIAMPVRVFLYTLDQLAALLNVDEETLAARYLYFNGLSKGDQGIRMMARNIEIDPKQSPRWRVAESEVMRYLVRKGFIVQQSRM